MCDYQNKRNPVAVHEVREFMKGHRDLHEKLQGQCRAYLGRRHAQRIISDVYGKGVVRGAVECVNLLTNSRENDVTAAECMRTARTVHFDGNAYATFVEKQAPEEDRQRPPPQRRCFPSVDARDPKRRCLVTKYSDLFYACGRHEGVVGRLDQRFV